MHSSDEVRKHEELESLSETQKINKILELQLEIRDLQDRIAELENEDTDS